MDHLSEFNRSHVNVNGLWDIIRQTFYMEGFGHLIDQATLFFSCRFSNQVHNNTDLNCFGDIHFQKVHMHPGLPEGMTLIFFYNDFTLFASI